MDTNTIYALQEERSLLLSHLDRLHTTDMGAARIRCNLCLTTEDVVAWCKKQMERGDSVISRKGKNWYIHAKTASLP